MTNIILAVDATSLDISALDFACYIAKLHRSKLTAVLLENLVANEKPVIRRMHGASLLEWDVDRNTPEIKEKLALIDKNVKCLESACSNRGVVPELVFTEGSPASEMIEQSRYADLLILDADTSFRRRFEGTPTDFVKDILKNSQCPVIIAPESFDGIDEIYFTYDGSASSLFAMKQFTYLFPAFGDKDVAVLHIEKENDWPHSVEKGLKNWLHNHYKTVVFNTREGDTDTEMLTTLFLRRNIFIVMGAYGRTSLSRFFKHSHADLLMRTITQPIFIAHH